MAGEPLPPEVRALIDEWILEAGLAGGAARAVRKDLEEHFRDGLEAGRAPADLIAAFGDPRVSAPMLAAAARDKPARAMPWAAASGLGAVLADLRYALRALRRSPLQTLVVVSVLSLGIGATAIAITIVDEILLKPLPIVDQERLVNVLAEEPGGNSFSGGLSIADFEQLAGRDEALVDLAAFSALRVPLGPEPTDERAVATLVSQNYFSLLGVGASAGTVSLPRFTGWGADDGVIVSHRFRAGRLAGDPGVLGSEIRLGGHPFTVIGVADRAFTGTFIGFPVDVWLPLSAVTDLRPGFDPDDPAERFLEVLGRRGVGVTLADAEADLDAVLARIERTDETARTRRRVRLVELTGIDESLRTGVTGFVTVLGGLAVLVLIVACLNAGGILLARSMEREGELAIRKAIGAGGARLARQLLLESLLAAGAAAVTATILSGIATSFLSELVAKVSGGLGLELSVDRRVLTLTAGAALLTAVVMAAAPAAHLLRASPAVVMRRGPVGRPRSWARRALIVGQVAVSLVLMVTAGLFTRALLRGLAVDPGFDADRVASVSLSTDAVAGADRRDLVERLRALPGVVAAGLARERPVGVARTPEPLSVPGVEPPAGAEGFVVDVRRVGPGYLEAVGAGRLTGRSFEPEDAIEPVATAVVSAAFAARFLGGGDPVGRPIEVDGRTLTVVGVVRDVRYLLQDESPDPLVYEPLSDDASGGVHVVLGAAIPPGELATSVRVLLAELVPHGRTELRTVRDVLSDGLLAQRVGVVMVGTMGIVALFLSTVGLHGLVRRTVRAGRRTLGIRMALGADRRHAVATVLRGGVTLVAVGTALGGAAALLVTPVLRPFLLDVTPDDPLTYLVATGLFLAVGLVASLVPAIRAAAIDPVEALRSD